MVKAVANSEINAYRASKHGDRKDPWRPQGLMATARVATTILRLLPVFVYSSGDPCGRHASLGLSDKLNLLPGCLVSLRPERLEGFLSQAFTRKGHRLYVCCAIHWRHGSDDGCPQGGGCPP